MTFIRKRARAGAALGLLLFFLTGSLFQAKPALAGNIEIQHLNFGEWIVRNNDTVHTITVQTNGSYSNSAGFIMISPPQEGIYEVNGLPPNSDILSVDVTMTQPLSTAGGNNFSMTNFQVIAPDTDATGTTTVTLGATAESTGDGVPYLDGVYTGEMTMQFNF